MKGSPSSMRSSDSTRIPMLDPLAGLIGYQRQMLPSLMLSKGESGTWDLAHDLVGPARLSAKLP